MKSSPTDAAAFGFNSGSVGYFFERSALVLDTLANEFDFEIAGARGNGIRETCGDESGTKTADASQ